MRNDGRKTAKSINQKTSQLSEKLRRKTNRSLIKMQMQVIDEKSSNLVENREKKPMFL